MKVKNTVFLVILLVGRLGSLVFAQDQFPPVWRGQDRTTFQNWTFDDNSNPVTLSNAAGDATATMTVGDFGAGWFYDYLDLGQQTGYWDIGGNDGGIVLDIDNFQGADSIMIRIQITYWEDISGKPGLNISPEATPYQQENWQDVIVDSDNLGAWKVWQSEWIMSPVPPTGQITLMGHDFGSIIDQIVVDTKATPAACIVDLDDLAAMGQQWLQSGSDLTYDLDNSGKVDMFDFSILAQYWQQACPW